MRRELIFYQIFKVDFDPYYIMCGQSIRCFIVSTFLRS
jgi:hypothetical protein